MSRGDLSQRVTVTSRMRSDCSASLQRNGRFVGPKGHGIIGVNKNLERKVRERTEELERSNQALQNAYLELQNAQEHLIPVREDGLPGPSWWPACAWRQESAGILFTVTPAFWRTTRPA